MNEQIAGSTPNDLISLEISKPVGPRELVFRYLKYLPWIAICVILGFVLGYIKIRYYVPIYMVQSSLLIKNDEQAGGGKDDRLGALFLADPGTNLANEIQLLRSTPVISRVVRNLNLQTWYYNNGKLRSSLLYKNAPFHLLILHAADSTAAVTVTVTVLNDREFTLDGDVKTRYAFNRPFAIRNNQLMLIRDPAASFAPYQRPVFTASWQSATDVAGGLASAIKIVPGTDNSTILQLSMETEDVELGKDVLNALMSVYDSLIVEDKNRIAVNTMQFIDKRLDTLRDQLGGIEGNLRSYQEDNQAFNVENQASTYLNNIEESAKSLQDQEVKITIVNWLLDYIGKAENNYRLVPTDLGIAEPTLLGQIAQYNQLVLERESNLKTTPAQNPLITRIDGNLDKVRQNMLQALQNVRTSYIIARDAIQQRGGQLKSQLKSIPGKSMRELNIQRRRKILEDLYSFLLQKRLETSISSASTISNSKVVEPAAGGGLPIKPNRNSLYMTYMLIGLIIPVAIIAIIEVMSDKVKNRGDIEKVTPAPILGEVGHSEDERTLVVTKNSRRFITEQFRIIRTNLQYIVGKNERPVILVTSSFSGEGKSFVSTNIGAVMALAGKKTVVMEFDIRKPKIVSGLDLKRKMGITNYIIGAAGFSDLLVKVDDIDNYYVIPCGPIPPNPAELLLSPRLDELIAQARREFEVVILDTAPVGLVSDAIILSKYADCTLYIVRRGRTPKNLLSVVKDLYKQKKLPSISILLNDVKQESNYYGGYYGGYGYYAYGYNNESGYFDKEGRAGRRKGFVAQIFGRFKRLFS